MTSGRAAGPRCMTTSATFRTTLLSNGKTATGIEVPPSVVESLGQGKRPPVVVTLGAHRYRSTVAVMAGRYMVGVSAENRAAAGVQAGDVLEVTLELDTAPRTVEVPAELQAALDAAPEAAAFFETLSPSRKQWHTQAVETAKTPETRQRRIAKSIEMLRAHQR